ncbi:neutral/alkaline non-lysosomal ceramidase N-terminal domain-containing protein [Novosphingobium flavum]|uniref:Neutral/alkaline non-lysosomal ceramidase N-terminal domain-containing protein n=1 Tax=Novosphingobium flavum TaxID=1778672 RepID=A0A7X1FS65_9SPHN|nr:neutral/alkaline non-lysosomal ceramidase N-terminal domain-containing protein [Novosphingobium flavum]MBC2666003.1 neutral/alkaline non-lysosomal ceramidase N-terminal domain-containing protein [Novosphingobium flavum]
MARATRMKAILGVMTAVGLVLPAFSPALADSTAAEAFRAGAAKAVITPPAASFPISSPSSPRDKPFVGIHDDLFARALVLEEGGRRIVLVSLEVTTVPQQEKLIAAVASAAGVPASQVLVFATHTHSNPLVFFHGNQPTAQQQAEMARTLDQAVAATREAVAGLRPAKIALARGASIANVNNGEGKGLTTKHDAAGVVDHTLDVVRVDGTDGKPLALLVNYPTHAEVMFRSVTKDGGLEVTGDIPGAVSRLLEGSVAPVVLYSAGAEGDQQAIYTSLVPAVAPLPAVDAGASGWALLDMQARRIALDAVDALARGPAPLATGSLSLAKGAATCPGQKLRRDQATGKVTTTATDPVAIPVALLKVGDFALAGVGADLGAALGKTIRAATPKRKTVLVSMIAGDVGYVLPDDSYPAMGHGVMGSPVKPGCAGPALIKELGRLALQR